MKTDSNLQAIQIIEENRKSQQAFLDLGNLGLTNDSPELKMLEDLHHVESINLGTYYYNDNQQQVFSSNTLIPNIFIEIPKTLPKSIKNIFISQTELLFISNINLYKSLKIFDGYSNKVEKLTELEINRNVTSFGLSHNKIQSIIGIEKFPSLRYLYLGENLLYNVNIETFAQLTEITEVHLYSNKIKELDFLKNSNSLKRLYLQHNTIEEINILSQLIGLEKVNLYNNPLRKDENDVAKLAMSTNSINASVVRSAIKKISLPYLLIEENFIKKARFLDLGNCGLNDQAVEFRLFRQKKYSHLKSLNLGTDFYRDSATISDSNNKLNQNIFTEIPEFLPDSLEELQIRNSRITRISNIEHLNKLKLLDLSFNEVQKITSIGYLKELRELALYNNNIARIEGLDKNKKLEILYLSGNRIDKIENLRNNPNLKSLFLNNNSISEIAPLTTIKALASISLSGNPIKDCPADIWKNNDVLQIFKYFDTVFSEQKILLYPDLEQSQDILSIQETQSKLETTLNQDIIKNDDYLDVKLIIVGNSNTGKSNLATFLQTGKLLDKRKSTHGLEVKRWVPNPSIYPQLSNIQVSIWDFGGQEYYHDAYRLFLGNDAVYILLWCQDSDANTKTEEVIKEGEKSVMTAHYDKRYWLDTLQYYKDQSLQTPLYIAQNKVDTVDQKNRVSQELHNKYHITDSFHISLINGVNPVNKKDYKNLNDFINVVAESLVEVAERNAQHTREYKFIRNEILALSYPGKPSIFREYIKNGLFIKLDDFQEVCRNNKIMNADYFHIWLNNGGSVAYFPNGKLHNKVFINPARLSGEIYTLLSREVLLNNAELLKIKEGKADEIEHRDLMINVMKMLGLVYEHPAKNDTHYLVPQYLPEEHPIEDLFKIASGNAWGNSFWIKIPLFFYKQMMNYLLLFYIKESNTTARYFWKNGILLLKGVSNSERKILIKGLFPTDGEGVIQVSVENCREADDLLKEVFKAILQFNIGQSLLKNNNVDSIKADIANITEKREDTEQNPLIKDLFFTNLQISTDKINYVDYNYLIALADKPETDLKKEIIRYQHIVPLKTVGIKPRNVFVSYSHKDAVWLGKIRNHLSGLRRSNYIRDWTDKEIFAGEKWDEKIKEQLQKADIVILLLSADFIASDYIWDNELTEAFKKNEQFGMKIIPVYIEPCDLSAIPSIGNSSILGFEIVPKDKNEALKPVSLWDNEAEALSKVAERIRAAIGKDI